MKLNTELRDLIIEQDLSVNKLVEDFCNIIIEDFGTHNYRRVIEVVNEKLQSDEK